TFVKGNIGDYDLALDVLRSRKVDAVVNFAAESHNSLAVLRPDLFVETNVLGTQRLLMAARDAGAGRFHHISTCEVYGDLALDSEDAFTEETPYRPRTPYNASKAAADLVVRAFHDTFGLPITISNCANNYGPCQFPEKVIPKFATNALNGQKLPLFKSSRNRREWIHVLDHCRAIDRILQDGRIGETYNVGTGDELDVETIADRILDILELDASHKEYVPDRPGHDRRYLLDSSKIRSELNWSSEVPIEEGFRQTVIWYRENRDWWEPLLERIQVDEAGWEKRD
ncbi:MAG: GDP-mannose 4,6-dehydratase, partial [Candidatus Latescibacteria bacterium]|nr:GDP-mannose 4,6-dehydratase [Candidatus Latescibacterota bacterium]